MQASSAKEVFLLIGILLLQAFAVTGSCRASSPGNFLALFPKEPSGISGFLTMQTEQQGSQFSKQIERRPEVNSQGEERHYSEIRELETTFSFDGIKTGAAFGRLPLVYVYAGYGRAEVDFSYIDELTENKESYSTNVELQDDGFPVFGGGVSAMAYDTMVMKNSRFSVGMDMQYRWLDFKAKKASLLYESTLHEIQFAVAASLENLQWRPGDWFTLVLSPYGGVKIMYFAGDETFLDPENKDPEGNPDPIRYADDIEPGNFITYFLGTNIHLTQSLFLGIETHFGDDKGYAFQLGYKF